MMFSFFVAGTPIPKQSFVYGRGHGHAKPEVKAWQNVIRWKCIETMREMNFDIITAPVDLDLTFYLPNKRRKDCDNLSKAVCDALNGVLYLDDSQIVKLTITKHYQGTVGVYVTARPVEVVQEHGIWHEPDSVETFVPCRTTITKRHKGYPS